MDDLIGEFISETSESLAALDTARLLRNPADQAMLGTVSRLVHTIKGTGGFLGLPRLESLAHAGEGLLGRIRDGEVAATPQAAALICETLDCIKNLLAALAETGSEPDGSDGELKQRLQHFVEAPAPALPEIAVPEPAAAAPAAPEPVEEAPAAVDEKIGANMAMLEKLMQTVGELVLTRNRLVQIARHRTDDAMNLPLDQLSQITTLLRTGIEEMGAAATSILPVLLVEAGGQTFAVPQTDIVEVALGKPEAIDGGRAMRLRGNLLPLLSLGEALQLQKGGEQYVVVLRGFGLTVDRIHDTAEIVLQPLDRALGGIAAYAGSAVLGDGSIAMVLNPAGLAGARNRRQEAA